MRLQCHEFSPSAPPAFAAGSARKTQPQVLNPLTRTFDLTGVSEGGITERALSSLADRARPGQTAMAFSSVQFRRIEAAAARAWARAPEIFPAEQAKRAFVPLWISDWVPRGRRSAGRRESVADAADASHEVDVWRAASSLRSLSCCVAFFDQRSCGRRGEGRA